MEQALKLKMHCGHVPGRAIFMLVLFLVSLDLVSCEEYYITPSQNYPCFEDSCLTLSQFADNSTIYTDSNTTLFIAGGSHVLDVGISVLNVVEFSMLSMNDANSSSVITCGELANFTLSNISDAYISGLTFMGCGSNQVKSVDQLTIKHSKFWGQNNSATSLTISDSNVHMTETSFVSNQRGRYRSGTEFLRGLQITTNQPKCFGATVGGALFVSQSTLVIDNCQFEGNRANFGGAIFSEMESNITISNSTFTSNKATGFDNGPCFGGGLFVKGTSVVIIRNSTFKNNTSDRDGGMAVAFDATLLVSQSYAYNNTAARYGGAVAVFHSSTVQIDNSSLYHNTALIDGGVVYADCNGNVTINYSKIVNNSASRFGGVLYIQMKCTVLVSNSVIMNNTAISGGVLYATGNTHNTLNNSNFIYNKADSDERGVTIYEGGVVFLNNNSTIRIHNSSFNNNTAGNGGGVVSSIQSNNSYSSVVISGSNFSSNTAGDYGGVVHLQYGGSVVVNESIFDYNHAELDGGVFDGYTTTDITVYRSTFANNRAGDRGGVSATKNGSNLITKGSLFYNNIGGNSGAVIHAVNKTSTTVCDCNYANYGGVLATERNSIVVIDNSTFCNNTAVMEGATLFVHQQCTVNTSNSFFISNRAINNGVMEASNSSIIILDSSIFSDNVAGHDGGAVYVYDNSTTIINNCSFTSNRVGGSGGAVYGRKYGTIKITESNINNCTAQTSGGGVYAQQDSVATIEASNLTRNSADYGGVVCVYVNSTAKITNSSLNRNTANISGGAMSAYKFSTIRVYKSTIAFNMAGHGGVSLVFQNSALVFENGNFLGNMAEFDGVIQVRQQSTLSITGSIFDNNTAENGGVLYAQGSNVTIETCSFANNSARDRGGVLYADNNCTISICLGAFSSNTVENEGGVMALLGGSVTAIESSEFTGNSARHNGGVIGIQESHIRVFNSTFSSSTAGSSGGIMRAINSSIEINNSIFTNNSAGGKGGVVDARSVSSVTILCSHFSNNRGDKSGGVLHLVEQSDTNVDNSVFEKNKAERDGGVISASTMSKVNVTDCTFSHNIAEKGAVLSAEQGSSISFVTFHYEYTDRNQIQIHNNKAEFGGGIFLSDSVLYFGAKTNISHNQANAFGGGVHAVDSSIKIGNTVCFDSNQAKSGGGISLRNSTLYDVPDTAPNITFILNQANYGGALYVDDSAACSSNPVYANTMSECFFQVKTKGPVINFFNNYTKPGCQDLFGGLLDRCTVASDTYPSKLEGSGVARFEQISNINNTDTICSKPVRVCLCKDNEPDCSQHTYTIQVKKGNDFTIPLAAIDQVGHTVTATINLSSNKDLILSENQRVQRIDKNCSNQVRFPRASEDYELTIYADGPCSDEGISKLNVHVSVLSCSCAHGFMQDKSDTKCTCVCDKQDKTFSKYITECDSTTESVTRKGQFWITYLNDTDNDSSSPYFIYPYCPLNYCQSPSKPISINLNVPNGADAQCANNRAGILCGSCQPNYSVSLGSSKCLKCPDNWYGLLVGIIIAAFFAGIVLVVLVLVLNLTVAVGTLNSIIFYANIIDANKNIYFGQSNLTFVPRVFISWLNLDIGFDTCFIEGMDAYTKTWLQLAFPVYIIFLVIIIIWMCSCSSNFSNLLGKRNPVATLATLILLSYTQLLETIIASFSLVPLKYPNDTTAIKWLPDASVEYGEGKHISLIFVAIFILILGLLYTTLVFSWQWFLLCPWSNLFKWTRNQKLHSFIDMYHTPHTAKHRYWTGLLLLVRVVVYLISAFTVSIDPHISLLSTVAIMCSLFLYKTLLFIRVYNNWLLNLMESFVYFNIAIFAIISWYSFDDSGISSGNKETLQTVAAYISIGATFIQFMFVIFFHVFRYSSTKMYLFCKTSKLHSRVLITKTQINDQNQVNCSWTPSDSTLLDVIDNSRKEGYAPPPLHLLEGPTSSDVSLTNCDESSSSDSPLSRPMEDNKQWQNAQDDDEGSMQAGALPSKNNSTAMATDFDVTKPKLLSFSYLRTSSKSMMKPLLEEDRL